jgi:hypothetical protein
VPVRIRTSRFLSSVWCTVIRTAMHALNGLGPGTVAFRLETSRKWNRGFVGFYLRLHRMGLLDGWSSFKSVK